MRLTPLVPLVVALIAIASTGQASAQGTETFTIEGHILNGTAGAEPPEGVRVQAYAYTSQRIDGPWEAQTDETGAYRVDGVSAVDGATYVLGVDYAGASSAGRGERAG